MAQFDSREERIRKLEKEKLKDSLSQTSAIMRALAEINGILSDRAALLKLQIGNILREKTRLNGIQSIAASLIAALLSVSNVLNNSVLLRANQINLQTLLVLRKYGINPKQMQPSSKTKTILAIPQKRTVVTGSTTNNIKTENLTTYNNRTTNEIKIVLPLIPVQLPVIRQSLGDGGKSIRQWLSNLIQNLNQLIELSSKEYLKKDWGLSKSADKMMRKIEDASKRFAENMNPQKIAEATSSLMKVVLMLVAAYLISAGFKPLFGLIDKGERAIKDVFGGGDSKDEGFSVFKGIAESISYMTSMIKEGIQDRKEAVLKVLDTYNIHSFNSGMNKIFHDMNKSIVDWMGKDHGIWGNAFKGVIGGLGSMIVNGLKGAAIGALSGTSFLGDMINAVVGGSSTLSNSAFRGIEGLATLLLTEGNEEWINFDGTAKNDFSSTLNISQQAIDNKSGEIDKETGTVKVRTANVIASVNSLSGTNYDVTAKDKLNKSITLRGTIVKKEYLEQILSKNDLLPLYNDDQKRYIIRIWGKVNSYTSKALTAVNKMIPGVNTILGLWDTLDKEDSHNLDKNSGNYFWNSNRYYLNDFTLYPDSDHKHEFALVTQEGWAKIKLLLGGKEGEDKLSLRDENTRVLIEYQVSGALGAGFNAKTQTVTYNSDTKEYDTSELDKANGYQLLADKHEANVRLIEEAHPNYMQLKENLSRSLENAYHKMKDGTTADDIYHNLLPGEDFVVGSGWGDPREYRGGVHEGEDIFFKTDKDKPRAVYAPFDGKIAKVVSDLSDENAGGRRITINSKDGKKKLLLCHFSEVNPNLKNGDEIKAGTYIGMTGCSGEGKDKRFDHHLHVSLGYNRDALGNFPDVPKDLIAVKGSYAWVNPRLFSFGDSLIEKASNLFSEDTGTLENSRDPVVKHMYSSNNDKFEGDIDAPDVLNPESTVSYSSFAAPLDVLGSMLQYIAPIYENPVAKKLLENQDLEEADKQKREITILNNGGSRDIVTTNVYNYNTNSQSPMGGVKKEY